LRYGPSKTPKTQLITLKPKNDQITLVIAYNKTIATPSGVGTI